MGQVSLKDIALRCGVSMQTVSRALRPRLVGGTTKVSDKTRQKILQVAQEMGYESNPLAVSLRGGMSRSIGIIQTTFRIEIGTELLNSVIRTLGTHGFECYISNLSTGGGVANTRELIRNFERRKVDGIIMLMTGQPISPQLTELPLLYVDNAQRHIGVDLEQGFFDLTEHLIVAHGHRKIGILGNNYDSVKEAGYFRALQKYGIQAQPEWSVHFLKNPHSMKELRAAIMQYGVTAFVCSNDYIAARTSCYLQQQGLRIPEDIALTGFDGMSFTKFVQPSITTMIQPMENLGVQAAQMMIDKVLGKSEFPSTPQLLTPRFRQGASCGCVGNKLHHIVWINTFSTIEEEEQSVKNFDLEPLPQEFKEELIYK